MGSGGTPLPGLPGALAAEPEASVIVAVAELWSSSDQVRGSLPA
jgi:hypothetical protein